MSIVIAATFTADAIAAPLEFLLELVAQPSSIQLAAWGQVFQSLLDRSSALRSNTGGVNIVLVRVSDLGRTEVDASKAARDLATALSEAATVAPLIVCLAPSQDLDAPWAPRIETDLSQRLEPVAGLYVLTHDDIQRQYPVQSIFDSYRERLGAVPYTELYFAAIAGSLARRIRSLRADPKKVVVVDCDDTLWTGLCGEAGPAGIVLDDGRLALQRFLVELRESGMLLCICSRNNPDDVMRVFDSRSDMLLRKEHITAWRVSWAPKSESISSIAQALGLGIDSFVFLDDDAFVCGEVGERCPGITVIQVPASQRLAHFVRQLWVFDRARVTDDDRNRALYYVQDAERRLAQDSSSSLGDFLATLELDVRVDALADAQVSRVAQLTQRTNQFNGTGTRRSEAEIRRLATDGFECHVVDVTDRFGSYGLVGVLITRAVADTLEIETFLLSCRVLGRGVEHRIFAELARRALARSLVDVTLAFRRTAKNAPFQQFFDALPARFEARGDDAVARISAAAAAELTYRPELTAASIPGSPSAPSPAVRGRALVDFGKIAQTCADASAILAQIAPRAVAGASVARTTAGEIETIWCEVLGVSAVKADDDFFRLGGNSLLAITMFSRIHERLGVELPLTALFSAETTLRAIVDQVASALAGVDDDSQEALLRRFETMSEQEALALLQADTQ